MTDVGSAALCFVSTRAPRGLRQNIRPSDYAGVVVHRSLRFAQNRFLYSFTDMLRPLLETGLVEKVGGKKTGRYALKKPCTVVTKDPKWCPWSVEQLERLAEQHTLLINPIIYSEVSIGFDRIENLDLALPQEFFRREALSWEARFLAGKCFVKYRRAGGVRKSPLPDFYIGAHAAIKKTREDTSANLGFEVKLWLSAVKLRNNWTPANSTPSSIASTAN